MRTEARLRIADYLPHSRANGPGLRSVLWVQGCPFRCVGCFNPAFLPLSGGREIPPLEVAEWMLAEPDTEGVSFSGGEPFAQAAGLADIAERVRAAGKGVLIFTGYSARELDATRQAGQQRLYAAADLLVAGRFEQRAQNSPHPLLASGNQELVHVTARYRDHVFGPRRRSEIRISAAGAVAMTGFPGVDLRAGLGSATVPGGAAR